MEKINFRTETIMQNNVVLTEQKTRKNPIHRAFYARDTIIFRENAAERKIVGKELIIRSAVGLTLGILPFGFSSLGQIIVKKSATLAQEGSIFLSNHGRNGLEKAFRILLGIPAVLGGLLLFGGAYVFSKAQQIAWGKELVEHPQEEKVNTKLARYGAGNRPWEDFKRVWTAFFTYGSQQKSIDALSHLRDFKIP